MSKCTDNNDFSLEGSAQAYNLIHEAIKPLMEGDDVSEKQIVFGLAMNVANVLMHMSPRPSAYYQFQQALHMALCEECAGEVEH